MKINSTFLRVSLLFTLVAILPAFGGTLHVSPEGDDSGDGSAEKPFGSLHRARDAARAEIARGLTSDLEIVLEAGTYRLEHPLSLGPEDSGTKTHSVTWRAAGRQIAVISGGCEIRDWEVVDDGTWKAPIPAKLRKKPAFRQLYSSCYWLQRARHPNEGYHRAEKVGEDRRSNFQFKKGALPELANLEGVELVFLHDWSISRSPVRSLDLASRTVTLEHAIAPGNRWSAMDWFEKQPRYFLENARAFLDEPREWYADWKEGFVYFKPSKSQRPDRFIAVAPLVDQLLVVKGTPERLVRNLRFEGLHFRRAGWKPTDGVYWGRQACTYFPLEGDEHCEAHPAAVQFDFVEDCQFREGTIRQCGGSGFWFGQSCRNNTLDRVTLTRLGGNGIMIGEGRARILADGKAWWEGAPNEAAIGNRVSNCNVFDCGREMFGSVGIWIGLAAGTQVTHNRLNHLPYTGISAGWMWWNPRSLPEPRVTPAKENRIAFNHISNVMQVLSDGGGIYCLGNQPGSTLTGNIIHDIPRNAGRAESNGMFLDQGTGSFIVENNLIYNVDRSPFRFHKGWTNIVRNNIVSLPDGIPLVRFNDTKPERIQLKGNREIPEGEELNRIIKEYTAKAGPRKREATSD